MVDGRTDGCKELRGGQLRVRDIWALGVGVVVCGQYFGWNGGLNGNGPTAMVIASLAVCLLFLAWVLTLSELAVAMPRAGGPLDYGLRAGGPWVGFLMGWSMFLECLFGGVATALAGGKYMALLLARGGEPDRHVAVAMGLTIVGLFLVLQIRGVKEQAHLLWWMTCAAIAGLVVFWIAALTNFGWSRVWTSPLLPVDKGWGAILDAMPFALWWLIIIEAAVLASEESHTPSLTIPRGLTWAVLTVIGFVVLTTVTATGAVPFPALVQKDGVPVDYPLAEVIRQIPAGQSLVLSYSFGVVALFGLVASYHGLLYGASRQLFALGRAGFVSPAFGTVNTSRQTPVFALVACSLLTSVFVVANLWYDKAIESAVLIAGFAALVLYVFSMAVLCRLRSCEPNLFRAYRAPLGALLPVCVVLFSLIALAVYPRIDDRGIVIPASLGAYAFGLGYFVLMRSHWLPTVCSVQAVNQPLADILEGRKPQVMAATSLIIAFVVLGAVFLASFGGPDLFGSPSDLAALCVLGAMAAAIVSVAVVELWQPLRGRQ